MNVKMVVLFSSRPLVLYWFDTERVVKVFANNNPNLMATFSAFKRTVFICLFFSFCHNL